MIFDPVGGSAFSDALKVARWGAQILIIGFASGTIPKVRDSVLPCSLGGHQGISPIGRTYLSIGLHFSRKTLSKIQSDFADFVGVECRLGPNSC